MGARREARLGRHRLPFGRSFLARQEWKVETKPLDDFSTHAELESPPPQAPRRHQSLRVLTLLDSLDADGALVIEERELVLNPRTERLRIRSIYWGSSGLGARSHVANR